MGFWHVVITLLSTVILHIYGVLLCAFGIARCWPHPSTNFFPVAGCMPV